jgi:hypothetical protein
VRGADQALREVAAPGFDPGSRIVLEEDPGIPKPSGDPAGGAARYRSLGPQAARVDVQSQAPAIVLVRNVWQHNWHATVDGKEVRILRADYLLQGIPVGAGRHTILLDYDDPTIGYGLLGSTLSLMTILLTAAGVRSRRRSRHPRGGDTGGPGSRHGAADAGGAKRPRTNGSTGRRDVDRPE